jgi:hypothetical protein
MQSTGHTITQTGHPEHSSGTITTSMPLSNIAPNSGGQLRKQVSHVMHSDGSIRRGGFFQEALRDRAATRADRSGLGPDVVSLPQGIVTSSVLLLRRHDRDAGGSGGTSTTTTHRKHWLNVATSAR